jgi:hypothetical protein
MRSPLPVNYIKDMHNRVTQSQFGASSSIRTAAVNGIAATGRPHNHHYHRDVHYSNNINGYGNDAPALVRKNSI